MLLTITEAAKYLKVTRPAVCVAIAAGKIKREKRPYSKYWLISKKELDDYKKRRRDRAYSLFEGKPLYDPQKGEITPQKAAKKYKIKDQRLYYLMRQGNLPYIQRGKSYVLQEADVLAAKSVKRRR